MGPFHVQALQILAFAGLLPREITKAGWYKEKVSFSHHKIILTLLTIQETQSSGERPQQASCLLHLFTVIILNMCHSRSVVSSWHSKHEHTVLRNFEVGERKVHINNSNPVASRGHYLTQMSYVVPLAEDRSDTALENTNLVCVGGQKSKEVITTTAKRVVTSRREGGSVV